MPKGALGGNLALHVLSFHWRAGSALLGAQLSLKWQVQATAHRKAYASLVHGSSTSRGLHCKNKSWRLLLHCPQTRLQLYHLALLCEFSHLTVNAAKQNWNALIQKGTTRSTYTRQVQVNTCSLSICSMWFIALPFELFPSPLPLLQCFPF